MVKKQEFSTARPFDFLFWCPALCILYMVSAAVYTLNVRDACGSECTDLLRRMGFYVQQCEWVRASPTTDVQQEDFKSSRSELSSTQIVHFCDNRAAQTYIILSARSRDWSRWKQTQFLIDLRVRIANFSHEYLIFPFRFWTEFWLDIPTKIKINIF